MIIFIVLLILKNMSCINKIIFNNLIIQNKSLKLLCLVLYLLYENNLMVPNILGVDMLTIFVHIIALIISGCAVSYFAY